MTDVHSGVTDGDFEWIEKHFFSFYDGCGTTSGRCPAGC